MRVFLWLLLASGTTFADVGKWGEDPRVVPSFSPREERRAPKCPDAPAIWLQLQADRARERIDSGLLICHLQVGPPQKKMDRAMAGIASLGLTELFNADVTLKLKLRKDPTIVLWAPWKHNESFVSIPAVTLARGDAIDLLLIDTHTFTADQQLGHARATWDGHTPLVLSTPKWTARCVLLDAGEARFAARPWIDSVDRLLAAVAGAKLDRAREHLGAPLGAEKQLMGTLRDAGTREGNFRYAAGFLGWADPEIQSRIARLKSAAAAFDEAAALEVEALESEATRGPVEIDGITLSFSRASIELRVDGPRPVSCASLQRSLGALSLVDALGRFSPVEASLRDSGGRRCNGDSDATLAPPLRGSLKRPARARLLRLANGRFVRID